jgi:hypothetical protein
VVAYDQPSVAFFWNAVIIASSPESVPPPARGQEPRAEPSTSGTSSEPASVSADSISTPGLLPGSSRRNTFSSAVSPKTSDVLLCSTVRTSDCASSGTTVALSGACTGWNSRPVSCRPWVRASSQYGVASLSCSAS